MGRVGIEIKRSGTKVGRPISQAIDYQRALWHLVTAPEDWFSLSWVFVWPMTAQHGPLGSILSQQRVGALREMSGRLMFVGGQHLLAVSSGDKWNNWRFTNYQQSMGRKAGSR